MKEKNFVQDVIPPTHKKSIRDIPVPARKKSITRPQGFSTQGIKLRQETENSPIKQTNIDEINGNNYEKGQRVKRFSIVAGIVLLLVLIFVILSNLDSAKVTIEPKTVTTNVDKTIPIVDLSDSTGSDSLGYRTIALDKEVSLVVKADNEEFIQTKATGTITIFNEYSDKSQNLIKNTRFESPDGLIYTIKNSVTVPGYKMVNGEKVAGKLDVEVVASEAGEKYDVESADFTIPGFKGQEPYKFFYGKTKTAISGGFDGIKKIVSADKIESASIDLKKSATDILTSELSGQVSKEFVAVYDQNSFTFGQISEEQTDNSNDVTLKIKASITAKVFNKIDLSNAVAADTVIEYSSDENILIKELDKVSLSISNITDTDSNVVGQVLGVNGNLTFVWQNNEEELKKALVNTKKTEFGSLINSFPGIAKANIVIKPFWKTRFPENTKDIEIVVVSN